MEVLTALADAGGAFKICSAILISVLYYEIQVLLAEKRDKRFGKRSSLKFSADDITVASSFSSRSTREVEKLQSELEVLQKSSSKIIQSLKAKIKDNDTESDKVDVLEQECKEVNILLEKERAKVLKFQSTHEATETDHTKALEIVQLKLDYQIKETAYQKKKAGDLKEFRSEERQKAQFLETEKSKDDAKKRLQETKIAALELKVATLKEAQTVQKKQNENLKKMYIEEHDRVIQSESESSKLSREIKEKESALRKLKLNIEIKMEVISEQKARIQKFERAHAEEQEKAKKIHEQLPQLLEIIKTEENKGMMLEKALKKTEVSLSNEQFKVEGLEKGLSTLTELITSKQKKIETLEESLCDHGIVMENKKKWLWERQKK